MSLLMQALKKAEHAKQQHSDLNEVGAGQDNAAGHAQRESISLAPIDTPGLADATAGPQDYPEIIAPVEAVHKMELAHPDAVTGASAQAIAPPDSPRKTREITLAIEPDVARHLPDTPAVPSPVAPSPDEHAAAMAASATAAAPERNAPASVPVAASIAAATNSAESAKASAGSKEPNAQQTRARSVFAAKQPSAARRTKVIASSAIALAGLLIAGFGYYYWQISSHSSGIATTAAALPTPAAPVEPAPETAAPPAAIAPSAELPLPENAAPAAGTLAAIPSPTPATPEAAPMPLAQPTAAQAETNAAAANASRASSRESASMAGAAPQQSDAIRIRQGSTPSHIHPALADAYQFFSSGDMALAQQQYRRVLRQEPNNRDALLGMAAIAVNLRQSDQAGAFYAKLLELDPADADAMAGMASLKQGDPAQSESSLKKILAQDPQAGAALFALGNLYAQQTRWAEAQQYYFRAFGSAQDNADYAFNLAVSLDRLNQGKLALEYYQRALGLSKNTQTSFDKSAVQRRAMDLKASLGD